MQLSLHIDGTVAAVNRSVHQIGRVPIILCLLWLSALWWGERSVFQQHAVACRWNTWESWPSHADPHHVLLIADPQLVDPHTYPGRPWPLSALTIWITDLYMKRNYYYLLQQLAPHTTLFLGDLFDGGREWATGEYESPEARFKQYGTNFWLREYKRFMNLFLNGWHEHNLHRIPSSEGRRIIASLPGNHDLGFAEGIDLHVKGRFDAHFGPLNRIDILGNHTFVSVDTVSLSAMDRPDPVTGSSGAGDGSTLGNKNAQIWKPAEDFLENARTLRLHAVHERYQQFQSLAQGYPANERHPPFQAEVQQPEKSRHITPTKAPSNPYVPSSYFPSILLSHVPLYRSQDVSCGPLREHGTSIPLSAGYQYQNVLTPMISSDIIKHLDADQVAMIYSGDDHDYCEIEHGEFTGRIREITVKSISMAMGVSRPGVQLTSLWNPIDMDGIAQGIAGSSIPRDTIQNHLCLLPFMEGILLRYLEILIFTLVILAVRAARYDPEQPAYDFISKALDGGSPLPLLPLSRKQSPPPPPNPTSSSSSNATFSTRPRSRNRLGGYGDLPTTSRSRSISPSKEEITNSKSAEETDDWGYYPPTNPTNGASTTTSYPHQTRRTRSQSQSQSQFKLISILTKMKYLQRSPSRVGEFFRSLSLVAGPVLVFYFWLIWNG